MTFTDPHLSEDQIDDLLYFARTGEAAEFLETLDDIAASRKVPKTDILLAARDEHSLNNVLHMTSANGHLELTKKILSVLPAPPAPDALPHALLAQKNSGGNTPLHWAALNGHLEVVKILVMAANADPTVTNAVGHDAVFEAELNDKKDVVDWLLGHCEGLEEGVVGDVEGQGEKGDDEDEDVEVHEVEDLSGLEKKLKEVDMDK